jgi:hypothetical protein
LNKYGRIRFLRNLDVNTEESILVTPDTKSADLDKFIKDLTSVSVRTFEPKLDKIKTPHFPIIKVSELPDILDKVFEGGFHAIVATPIDPKDCLLAGTIWKQSMGGWIELAKGPCTVRRVTHDSVVDYRYNYPKDRISDENVREMLYAAKRVPYENCILEMSYYSIPVGFRKENVIIWDITGDGTPSSIKL